MCCALGLACRKARPREGSGRGKVSMYWVLVNPAVGRGGACAFGIRGPSRGGIKYGGASFRRFKHGGIALGPRSL